MNLKQIAVLMATGLFAAATFSGEHGHQKMSIVVVDSDDNGETRIELDSDDLGFRLHDLQVGENRSIVDKEGRSILITRVEEGFSFEVDGKTIEMPAFAGHNGKRARIHGSHDMGDIDIRVLHDGMSAESMGTDGVMIISGKEIDEATQQLIRSTLESAGHSDVSFVDGAGDGEHQVRVIKKVVRN